MKLLVAFAILAVAAAAPQLRSSQEAQLVQFESDNDGLGTYRYAFEQDDGQKHDEQGELLNAGSENESLVVKGSYSWVGPDDVMYLVRYTADENGFQPTIEQGPGGAVPPGVVASLLG